MTIDILFIHPNFPGQFQRLMQHLVAQPGYRLTAVRDSSQLTRQPIPPGVQVHSYTLPEDSKADASHAWARTFNSAVQRAQVVAELLLRLKLEGYEPDLIYAHTGWGDTLYLKELFPEVPLVGLFEYFYHARGADVGFDPGRPLALNDIFRVPMLNASLMLALEDCDHRLTPTQWQRSLFPETYRERIECLHEGVNTELVKPDPTASLSLPNGQLVKAGDEVLTYTCRGFEPYRGLEVFMKALPRILEQRPDCQVLMVGSTKHFYGPGPAGHETWLDKCMAELPQPLPADRVHFLGVLDYPSYLRVLQVSSAHVYMTYPFVLSWSMLEAMAAGCLVLASDTAPVREVIASELNGLLFPFFDEDALVETATRALANPESYRPLRAAAVTTIEKRYDFARVVLPRHMNLIQSLTAQKGTL